MAVSKTADLKFALLTGALKNAGDFLIDRRGAQLIRHVYPNAELFIYDRCKSLEPYLYEINGMDALIFCGGPAYIPRLYPQGFPLAADLDRIQVPMFALGLGWFGSSNAYKALYRYHFEELTLELLKRIESDTKTLGCRDWYSVSVLRNNGIYSGKMTGCPAWYYPEYLNQDGFSHTDPGKIRKICLSEPANTKYLGQLADIAAYMKKLFPKAEMKAVFHRGIQADAYTDSADSRQLVQTAEFLQNMGIACTDISYGQEGFSIYDDCDLHIGFRVHAHIYNLSRRNISILIEEDGRGAGVNRALGLEGITAYDYSVISWPEGIHMISTVGKTENTYLLQMTDDYINNLFQTDFLQIKNAYRLMQSYYRLMEQHVQSLCEYI